MAEVRDVPSSALAGQVPRALPAARGGQSLTTPAELLLATVWAEILGVDDVGPEDDFFALGGDSLVAIKVVGAARERGLPLTLVHLFKNPTLRAACTGLAVPAERAVDAGDEFLAPDDRSRTPADAEAVYPPGRLQLGLVYESLLSNGALYVDVVSRTVNLPLDTGSLREALDRVARRHEILRTRFDLGTLSEPMLVVLPAVEIPLGVADYRAMQAEDLHSAHENTMRALAQPFEVEKAPLLRVHAAAVGDAQFRLSYSFHHAILDGWSESVLTSELLRTYDGLRRGTPPSPPDPVPFHEFIRLERAVLRCARSGSAPGTWTRMSRRRCTVR